MEPTVADSARVCKALRRIGAPLNVVRQSDFTGPDTYYKKGVEPDRVDMLTTIAGATCPRA